MHKNLAFILCAGHSGSTFLGHFIGSHPDIIHLGEVYEPLMNHQYTCRYCLDSPCPIWGKKISHRFLEQSFRSFQLDKRLSEGNYLYIKQLLRWGKKLLPAYNRNLFIKLFDALPETKVIVDSSKRIQWTEWGRQSRGYQTRYILLIRDLRGIVSSRMRRFHEDVETAGKTVVATIKHLLKYTQQKNSSDVLTIKYEDMAQQSEITAAAICDFFKLPMNKSMLAYDNVEPHILGGNGAFFFQARSRHGKNTADLSEVHRNYYDKQNFRFKIDLRWKEELDEQQLEAFEKIGGELNRELGYQ